MPNQHAQNSKSTTKVSKLEPKAPPLGKVLIVYDDVFKAKLLAHLLEETGLVAEVAHPPFEVDIQHKLGIWQPAVVVLGLRCSSCNPKGLLQIVNDNAPTVRKLACIHIQCSLPIKEITALPFDSIVSEDLDPEEITEVVLDMLEGKSHSILPLATLESKHKANKLFTKLNKTQRRIAKSAVNNSDTKAIALDIGKGDQTVRNNMGTIYRVLQCVDISGLRLFMIYNDIV